MLDAANSLSRSLLLSLISLLCFSISSAFSCSRVLYADQQYGVMVGRNMDWNMEVLADVMRTNLIVYPRGIARNGNTTVNPVRWTAKYGSIVATALHDTIATDGMNEYGLAAHTLWFEPADYGKRDQNIPGLSISMWVQFFLDNFKSVNEAVNYVQTTPLQITPIIVPKINQPAPQHIALEDATGDSAIIEYIAGKPRIYHDKKYVVATNEPSYQEQLQNLQQYKGFGGNKPLPGSLVPKDRFVRASYYISRLPRPSSSSDEIAKIRSVMHSIAEPYEVTSAETHNPIPTIWQAVADLTHKKYYFHDQTKLNMIWVDLNKFNLAPGAAAMKLDLVGNDELAGDVTPRFAPFKNQGRG